MSTRNGHRDRPDRGVRGPPGDEEQFTHPCGGGECTWVTLTLQLWSGISASTFMWTRGWNWPTVGCSPQPVYRTRLVPRWLSGWGLLGATAYWAAGMAVLYGAETVGPTQVLLNLPLAVQEMVLGAWLLTKGFHPAAFGPAGAGSSPVRAHAS